MLDTSASSALGVLDHNCGIYFFTYLMAVKRLCLCIAIRNAIRPGDVGVKRRDLRVEFLISADERVLVDLPDLAVVVPRRQVAGQILPVGRHADRDLPLDLLDLRVLGDHLVDRLSSQPPHTIRCVAKPSVFHVSVLYRLDCFSVPIEY